MKKFYLLLLSSICLFSLASCNNEDPALPKEASNSALNDLLDVMNAQKNELANIMSEYATISSRTIPNPTTIEKIEIAFPESVLFYFDLYSSEFLDIKVEDLLRRISQDPQLTQENKIDLAEIFGCAEYVSETMDRPILSRTSKADCLNTWKQATKRLMTRFLANGAISILTGNVFTLVGETTIAWTDNDRALDNYNKCMQTAK